MHQALYRKYRPITFDDVYGQDHITSVLKYEVANNKVSHAYLFCGSRGTGKTTCAKILAKAANCLSPINGDPCGECEACRAIADESTVDIYEMDAASNTGVNYIRDIKDAVVYSPAMLKTRVYIIDEVHMLSTSAFNALLKTLEEPPERVIFILATTEVHKIPITVLSRCQRFDFKRIKSEIIADRLNYIAQKENIELDRSAAMLIARLSNGGMRDAISLLEVCAGQNHTVNIERVRECGGISGKENLIKTVDAIAKRDIETLFEIIAGLCSSSMDISVFWQELIAFYRDMMLAKTTKKALYHYELSEDEIEQAKQSASLFTLEQIMYHSRLLDKALGEMQQKTCDKRICAELTLVRMSESSLQTDTEALLARISELEDKINVLSSGILPVSNVQVSETVKKDSPELPQVKNEAIKTHIESKFKSINDWMEIVKRFEKVNPMDSAYLNKADASAGNGEFIVRFPDNFSKMMIETEANYKLLCDTIIKTNPNYATLRVLLQVDPSVVQNQATPFDDINF
ncbi:MAG: DNA polymerase III subunit gamma/tau [Ruminococcaceae bacterium]|nr:DNA polymerase III subunit gamma/tau [Oscillospiraceae bacterium]